jgi:hypothetical protein
MINENDIVYARGIELDGNGEGFKLGMEVEFVCSDLREWCDVDDSVGCGVEVMDVVNRDVYMVEVISEGVDVGNGLWVYRGLVDPDLREWCDEEC